MRMIPSATLDSCTYIPEEFITYWKAMMFPLCYDKSPMHGLRSNPHNKDLSIPWQYQCAGYARSVGRIGRWSSSLHGDKDAPSDCVCNLCLDANNKQQWNNREFDVNVEKTWCGAMT